MIFSHQQPDVSKVLPRLWSPSLVCSPPVLSAAFSLRLRGSAAPVNAHRHTNAVWPLKLLVFCFFFPGQDFTLSHYAFVHGSAQHWQESDGHEPTVPTRTFSSPKESERSVTVDSKSSYCLERQKNTHTKAPRETGSERRQDSGRNTTFKRSHL